MAVDYTKANLLYGTSGNDVIDAQAGNDTVYGHAGDDLLRGGTGNDFLYGEAGNDTLEGGNGTDHLDGGAGSDTALYTVNISPLLVDLALGRVSFPGHSWPAETLVSIENIETGSGNDTVTGSGGANRIETNAGDDSITAGAGNDTLDGGTGSDRLEGGVGNDSYYIDDSGDVVTETVAGAAGGTDTVYAGTDVFPAAYTVWTLGANFENLTLIGVSATGVGNSLANVMTGNAEDNSLEGLAGNDTLSGAGGDDTLTGGSGNDTMIGGAGNDTLIDGNGTDRFDGGTGYDTASYAANTAAIKADLTLGTVSFPGHTWTPETLVSIENFRSGSGNDVVSGNSSANLLEGAAGDDSLSGMAGNDTLTGGTGNDTLKGGDGNDLISGGSVGSFVVFHGDGTYPESNSYDPPTYVDGRDVIDGGAGVDTVEFPRIREYLDYGYTSSQDPDISVDLVTGAAAVSGQPIDKLSSIENVVTGDGDDLVNGDGAANIITVNDGFNIVNAGGGNDTIFGGKGVIGYRNDSLHSHSYSEGILEHLNGGDGNDVIFGNGSILDFSGYHQTSYVTREDVLSGGAGNDRLVGGLGLTDMTGGAGADHFEFSTNVVFIEDETVGDPDTDHSAYVAEQGRITDFSRSEGDKIVISIDHASAYYPGDGVPPKFVGQTETAGMFELGYHRNGLDTVVEMQVADDVARGPLSLEITLADYSAGLQASDFIFT